MPEHHSARGAHDRTHIRLSDEQDVRYWTTALAVPEDELRRLVAEAGDNADAVRDALAKKSPPSIFVER